jgi:hypothetical protein
LVKHDLFGKPVSTFPDHALDKRTAVSDCGPGEPADAAFPLPGAYHRPRIVFTTGGVNQADVESSCLGTSPGRASDC